MVRSDLLSFKTTVTFENVCKHTKLVTWVFVSGYPFTINKCVLAETRNCRLVGTVWICQLELAIIGNIRQDFSKIERCTSTKTEKLFSDGPATKWNTEDRNCQLHSCCIIFCMLRFGRWYNQGTAVCQSISTLSFTRRWPAKTPKTAGAPICHW